MKCAVYPVDWVLWPLFQRRKRGPQASDTAKTVQLAGPRWDVNLAPFPRGSIPGPSPHPPKAHSFRYSSLPASLGANLVPGAHWGGGGGPWFVSSLKNGALRYS